MKNELDTKHLLQVFDKIRKFGEKKGEEYHLNGIKAFTDLDGYTLFLEDAKVNLSFGFHSQYHFEYESRDDFESFQKKLKSIDKEY